MTRPSIPFLAAALLTVLLPACSGGGRGGLPELPPVALTSSSPADGALGVATTAKVTLTFSDELDASSVSGSSASLRCTGAYTGDSYWDASESLTFPAIVPVAVSYAASTRTLTVAPRSPLATRRRCVLETHGLRDGAGRAVTATLSFRTLANPMTQRLSYSGDAISSWAEYEHDEAGNVIWGMSHHGPGDDGEWLTADDPQSSLWSSTYDAAGNWLTWIGWSGPGPDLLWHTADDELAEFRGAVFDGAGRVLRVKGFGGPGPDGAPFTSDDLPWGWSEIVRSPGGDVVAEKFHSHPGLDGSWFGADDPTDAYDGFSYDAPGGRLTRLTTVFDAGADGAWLTPDDVPDYYYDFQYEAPGVHDATVHLAAPGPDGSWFTADDVADSCQRVSYDARLLPTRFAWYRAGDDGRCFTADDYLYSYRALSYAGNGGLEHEVSYGAAGPDGEWFTADDGMRTEIWFDPTL